MPNLLDRLAASNAPRKALGRLADLAVYPESIVEQDDALYFLGRRGVEHVFGVLAASRPDSVWHLEARAVDLEQGSAWLGLGPLDHANAQALRAHLPWTAPCLVGLATSAGLGDRLGIATPGHIRALKHVRAGGGRRIAPILAQQSIREMERTARTPEQVMDDATWGVLQEGWRAGFGADADHLKAEADIDRCAAAGFLWFTLDPRDHVDNAAEDEGIDTHRTKYEALPWDRLGATPAAVRATYLGRTWNLGSEGALTLSEEALLRAACKYGRALAHLAGLYRYLERRMAGCPYELEVSVDEADTPTTPEEHLFIANELRRLGVSWVSLAPRYIGRFEKGVDYLGDLARFEADFARHAAIARTFGPYKLSLHSGSDKFSIYPIAARLAGGLVHLKTAGTSYLEALRAVARVDPPLFRDILAFAIAHYEADKVSYHVSADLAKVPAPASVADDDLPDTLECFDARQALHVTFGTVLTTRDAQGSYLFRDRLMTTLAAHEEEHYRALEAHFLRHLTPFSH
ncbi:MAG: tagaturonate epimerase family protein [Anaerolineae bacterium]